MRESSDIPTRAGGLHVVFLTAGSPATGAGHVVRSLALADEAARAGHHVTFAGRFEGAFVRGQLEAAGVEVVGPEGLVSGTADVVHVDSYHLDVTPADLSASGAAWSATWRTARSDDGRPASPSTPPSGRSRSPGPAGPASCAGVPGSHRCDDGSSTTGTGRSSGPGPSAYSS